MSYCIDFGKITLDQYRAMLKNKNFIPSRQILQDQAVVHFDAFREANIHTLAELFSAIGNPKTKNELLKNSSISDEYLAILLRELKSIQPKPIKLSEFDWIPERVIAGLEKAGIVNTKMLYEKLGKANKRMDFLAVSGIDEKEIMQLLKMSDLTRIQWVNTTFARVLYLAGFDTVAKVSRADPEDLYRRVLSKNDEMKLYKGTIGKKDMRLCIEAALSIDAEIEV